MIIEIIKILVLLVWVFVVPAYLVTLLYNKKTLENFLVNFSFVLIFFPVLTFYIILFRGDFVTILHIIIMSTIINFIFFSKVIKNKKYFKLILHKKNYLLVVILLIIGIFSFVIFSFPSEERFSCTDSWAYQYLGKDYLFGEDSTQLTSTYPIYGGLVEKDENITNVRLNDLNISNVSVEQTDNYRLEKLYYRIEKQNNRSIIKTFDSFSNRTIMNDEPYSVGIHTSYFISLFNFIGFRILFCLIMVCSSAILFFVLYKITGKYWLTILGVLLINISLIAYQSTSININYLAMFIVIIIIYILIKPNITTPYLIIAGALYGLLGSIRPITLLFVPGFIIYFYYYKFKKIVPFILGATILVLPVLILNYLIYKNPLQFPGFVYYPLFEHTIFGLKFHIRTLFNYPLYHSIIRTPGFPYPVFIYLPLFIIKNFGLIMISTIPLGYVSLNNKIIKYLHIIIPGIFITFLMLNENWRNSKTTLLLIILPFLIILSIVGIKELIYKYSTTKILICLGIIILIITGTYLVKNISFLPDHRFPSFSNSDENVDYLNIQKNDIINVNLFPTISFNSPELGSLKKEIEQLDVIPPLLNRFLPCINENAAIFGYYIFSEDEKNYLIMPHIFPYNYTNNNSKIIDSIDITKNEQYFKDVSSPDHCYTFDFMIINEENSIKIVVYNISQREYSKTINAKVKLINEGELIRLNKEIIIIDNNTVVERNYVN